MRRPGDRTFSIRTQQRVTIGFLAAFFAFGFSGAEWWPMTSWHLFSGIRTRHVEVWRATTIDASGRETPIPFSTYGVRYAGWYSRLVSFRLASQERKRAECDAWAREVHERTGATVRAVVVYRGDEDRGARASDRAAEPAWQAAFRCENGHVRVMS